MRELKFRAFNTRTRQFLFDFEKSGGFNLIGEVTLFGLFDKVLTEDMRNLKITQITGLHDKNGKPIYEGDIIQGLAGPTIVSYDIKNVRFIAKNKTCYIHQSSWNEKEVIGNIFENPELMEEK